MFAPILSIGERNDVDVRVSDSDTKFGANFQGVRHGHFAQALIRRARGILRYCGLGNTLIQIHLEERGEGGRFWGQGGRQRPQDEGES